MDLLRWWRNRNKRDVVLGAKGSDAVVASLLKLPAFNEKLFIEAMGCTSNRNFVCWKRPAA